MSESQENHRGWVGAPCRPCRCDPGPGAGPSLRQIGFARPSRWNMDHPAFFSLEGMRRENEGWCDETLDSYLGGKDGVVQPGDIDPARSVVIADLGPDRLVALDYRKSQERPSVVYLTGNEEPRWVEAAPDVETLLRVLGL